MATLVAILDFWSDGFYIFLICKSPLDFLRSFESTDIFVQEKLKIDFSIFSSDGHLVHWSKTILAILVESYLENVPVKFDWNLLMGVGGVVI